MSWQFNFTFILLSCSVKYYCYIQGYFESQWIGLLQSGLVWFGALAWTPNLIWGLVWFGSGSDIFSCWTEAKPKPPIQGTHVTWYISVPAHSPLALSDAHSPAVSSTLLPSSSPPSLSNSPYKLCPQWWRWQQWANNVATAAYQHCEGQSTWQNGRRQHERKSTKFKRLLALVLISATNRSHVTMSHSKPAKLNVHIHHTSPRPTTE